LNLKIRELSAQMLRTGVDLIEIERVRGAVERYGDRFLRRVFTPAELVLCRGHAESLAGRFAAKEAVAKALGTGVWREGIDWREIEILRAESGEPMLRLHADAAERAVRLAITHWSISLSHNRTQAIAFAVALVSSSSSPSA
jgi:holo-[acyl-carrier protein] synthase